MSNIGPVSGAGGVDKALEDLLVDMLKCSLKDNPSPCKDTLDGLQDLRDLINGNQRKAARQCQHTERAQGERTGNGPGREGVLQMLRKLMLMMLPMLEHLQKCDGFCQPTPDALRHALAIGGHRC